MTTSLPLDSHEVTLLKVAINAQFGKKPTTPADFTLLSLQIEQTTGHHLNPDTLSRLYGYKQSGYATLRKSTIDILQQYAHAEEESTFIHSNVYHAEQIAVGERLQLNWLPDRDCIIEHLGECRWRVVAVKNSKLQVGDTFSCRSFAEGEELILDKLHTSSGDFEGYAIATMTGIGKIEVLPH